MAQIHKLEDTGEIVTWISTGPKSARPSAPFFELNRYEAMQGFNDTSPSVLYFSSLCAAREIGDTWTLSAPWLRHSHIKAYGHGFDWSAEFASRDLKADGRPIKRERR